MELFAVVVVQNHEEHESLFDDGEGVFPRQRRHSGIVEDKAGECLATVDLVGKLSLAEVAVVEAVLREGREHIGNIVSSDGNGERGESEDEEV